MVVRVLGFLALALGVSAVWLAITKSSKDKDPDAKFWFGFTGFCLIAPLLLITALIDRELGLLALVVVVVACLVVGKFAIRSARKRKIAAISSRVEAEYVALEVRQDSVLCAWSRYEWDPEASLEFPAMHDVNVPEVSVLVNALAEAERWRREPRPAGSRHASAGYIQAVGRLERAFRRAERAITAPARATWVSSPRGARG